MNFSRLSCACLLHISTIVIRKRRKKIKNNNFDWNQYISMVFASFVLLLLLFIYIFFSLTLRFKSIESFKTLHVFVTACKQFNWFSFRFIRCTKTISLLEHHIRFAFIFCFLLCRFAKLFMHQNFDFACVLPFHRKIPSLRLTPSPLPPSPLIYFSLLFRHTPYCVEYFRIENSDILCDNLWMEIILSVASFMCSK